MIDLCKVADLALFLIDVTVGFEMELFEAVSILKTHGFPNVMGVLTHLDMVKDNKSLQKLKKRMKDRFWKEVYHGSKFFSFSGLENDGMYKKKEVITLCRYVGSFKSKELSWRKVHSYILADRHEVVPLKDSAATIVSFFGWVRGADFNQHLNDNVHIPGYGDFKIHSI